MDMIADQLDDARARFTAIGPGHHGDTTASLAPQSGHPDACHRRNGTGRNGRRGRPPRAKSRTNSLWTCLTISRDRRVAG